MPQGTTAHSAGTSAAERRALGMAFLLNAGLSAALFITGILGDSSSLIANAADNTSDAVVYAISFYAVRRGTRWKTRAAQLSGGMLLVLSAAVIADVIRRYWGGAEPVSSVMLVMAVVAAGVNIGCLRILRRVRDDDVNLRAAWTFSINDLLSNVGIVVAAILVPLLNAAWPDLVVGLAIAIVAAKGGLEILQDARRSASNGR